jgi:hypothetical protein
MDDTEEWTFLILPGLHCGSLYFGYFYESITIYLAYICVLGRYLTCLMVYSVVSHRLAFLKKHLLPALYPSHFIVYGAFPYLIKLSFILGFQTESSLLPELIRLSWTNSCLARKIEWYQTYYLHQNKTNTVALSQQANYTDWATATCRRNLVPTFVDRRVSRGHRGGQPTSLISVF